MGKAYLGCKATASLCQPLVGIMSPYDMYIGTHLGAGDILKRKPPAIQNIGIDLDATAIVDFSCNYPVKLIHGCCHEFDKDFLVYWDPPILKVLASRLSGIGNVTMTRKRSMWSYLRCQKRCRVR